MKTEEEQETEEVEDLSNYQLARDRVRREIVKPARYTEDSDVAFALSIAEIIDSQEPNSYVEAMGKSDGEKWNVGMDDCWDQNRQRNSTSKNFRRNVLFEKKK